MLAQGFSILTFYFLFVPLYRLSYGPVDKAVDALPPGLCVGLDGFFLALSTRNLISSYAFAL